MNSAVRRGGILAVAAGTALSLAPMAMADAGPVAEPVVKAAPVKTEVGIAAAKRKTKINKTHQGTRIKGWVGWHDGATADKAQWNVRVTDTTKNNSQGRWCAQAKIIADIANGNDDEYWSNRACGKGKYIDFKLTTGRKAFMRGVKIHACRNLPVSNSYRSCMKRVQYVKNPYYAW